MLLLLSGAQALVVAQQPLALQFEAASIKPAARDSRDRSIYDGRGMWKVRNLDVRSLIESAYDVLHEQIVSAPSWIDSERYDIDARCEEIPELSTAAVTERNLVRFRALLEDRFQLKAHRETRESQTYILVAPKWSGKLKPAQVVRDHYRRRGNSGHTEWEGASMEDLARFIAREVQKPVTNQTGIEGQYDFFLDFDRPEEAIRDGGKPSLFSALPDQLGLKLQSRKAPVEFLVIDHIERPTEN